MPNSRQGAPPSARQWSWLRIAAGLLGVFWGFVFYGVIDLLAFLQGPDFHESLLLSTGWGLLFLGLAAAPLLVVCLGSSGFAAAATAELGAVAAALLIAAVLGESPRYVLPAGGVALSAVLLAALDGDSRRTWSVTWRWSIGPAAVLAVAVLPLGYYAWTSARNTGTNVRTGVTAGLDHWPAQAALPLAALLVCAAAAGHPRGWRVLAWSVTGCGVWFAVMSWLNPDLVGSVDRWWSAALFLWSLAFLGTTEFTARPERPIAPRSTATTATRG